MLPRYVGQSRVVLGEERRPERADGGVLLGVAARARSTRATVRPHTTSTRCAANTRRSRIATRARVDVYVNLR